MKKFFILLILLTLSIFGMELKSQVDGFYDKVAMIGGTNKAVVAMREDDSYGVKIVDFTSGNLAVVGEYNTTKGVMDVAVNGDYAYLAVSDGEYGLVVLNISDSFNPSFVTHISLGTDPYYDSGWRIAISEDKTKLAVASSYNLMLFDLANPANPSNKIELNNYLKNPYVNDMMFSKDSKYLVTTPYTVDDSISIIDVSNISSIKRVGDIKKTVNSSDIVINDDMSRIYVNDGGGTSKVLSYSLNKNTDGNFTIINDKNISINGSSQSSALALSSDESIIYFGSAGMVDSVITAYNLNSDTNITIPLESWSAVLDIALSGDEKYILTTKYNGGLYLVDTQLSTVDANDEYSMVIKPGWNLLGAVEDIDTFVFPESIKTIWNYKDGTWYLHTNDALQSLTDNNFGFISLTNISMGDGFWVFNDTQNDVVVNNSSSEFQLVSYYEFDNGFENTVTGNDDASLIENSANVDTNGSLNLKMYSDTDERRYVRIPIDTTNIHQLMVSKRSKVKWVSEYSIPGVQFSNGSNLLRVVYNYYHNSGNNNQNVYDNREHFYLTNVLGVTNDDAITQSELLAPRFDQWIREVIYIDFDAKIMTYTIKNDDGSNEETIVLEDIVFQRSADTKITFYTWSWNVGSEHIIDNIGIYTK